MIPQSLPAETGILSLAPTEVLVVPETQLSTGIDIVPTSTDIVPKSTPKTAVSDVDDDDLLPSTLLTCAQRNQDEPPTAHADGLQEQQSMSDDEILLSTSTDPDKKEQSTHPEKQVPPTDPQRQETSTLSTWTGKSGSWCTEARPIHRP